MASRTASPGIQESQGYVYRFFFFFALIVLGLAHRFASPQPPKSESGGKSRVEG